MVHRTLILIAAVSGALTPGLVRGGESLAELSAKVEAMRRAKNYAGAAKLAAAYAEREDRPDFERVVFGGLAQQNYQLSYDAGGPLTDLCEVARVMRLVAGLDSAAGRASKLNVAMKAEAKLEKAAGPGWRVACAPDGARAEDPLASAEASRDGSVAAKQGTKPSRDATPGHDQGAVDVGSPARGEVGPVLAPHVRIDPAAPDARRRFRAGLGTLTPGLLLFAPMAALLAYRAQGERTLWKLHADAAGRELTAAEGRQAESLRQRYQATTAGAAVLGATGAALVVTGVVLLATGGQSPRVAVAPWGARGVGGLVLEGRF